MVLKKNNLNLNYSFDIAVYEYYLYYYMKLNSIVNHLYIMNILMHLMICFLNYYSCYYLLYLMND
jgi:hypothetical protein